MANATLVRYERVDDVVVLTLDSPPVNTLGRPLRRALMAELERVESESGVGAVVITGEQNFSAGADLAEFDSGDGLAEPTLHLTICGFLDGMTKPTVAAIKGVALGGGLELALACSARIAHPTAKLGLPETTLGFMPGAGGTQRLPRAVGIETATNFIASGRSADASEARAIGLVSEIDEHTVDRAIAHARTLVGRPKPRLRDLGITEPLAQPFIDAVARATSRNPRANQGVRDALQSLANAVALPFDTGLARELELFEHLASSPEARAARYRFLSERSTRKLTTDDGAKRLESAAVVGAGTMGRGIALSLLAAGIPTTLIDTDEARVDAGVAALSADLDRSVSRGRLSDTERTAQLGKLTTAVGLAGASDVDLVIEAVFENLDVKRAVFSELDAITRPDAILASNTSSLDLDAIAETTSRAGEVIGMHFFSPANVMRLIEVVEGAATSRQTLSAVVALARRIGKLPVIARVGPGFIGNRIFDAYLRQANLLVVGGVRPDRIDMALENWGMAMGPFRVLDVVGNDVPADARAAAGTSDSAWAVADRVVAAGWLGRKSGTGWYEYGDDGKPRPNTALDELLADYSTESVIDDDEIVGRCILAMTNELAAVVTDEIASNTADADTVMVNGYGFPASRGGPWFFAREQGFDRVERSMLRWRLQTGDPFWQPAALIAQEAAR